MKFIYLILFIVLFGFNNVYALDTNAICNNEYLIPFINIISTVINLIKIVVPIILIILGMLDMGKAVASQKEDEIKKGQKTLMSRCIAAGIVFFVVAIVQLLFGIIGADDDNKTMWNCIDKFVNGVGNSGSNPSGGRPNNGNIPEEY